MVERDGRLTPIGVNATERKQRCLSLTLTELQKIDEISQNKLISDGFLHVLETGALLACPDSILGRNFLGDHP